MDGQCGPETKLRLGKVERVSDYGKDEQRDGVQDKDRTHRDSHCLVARRRDGRQCSDGTASANGSTGGDQETLVFPTRNSIANPMPTSMANVMPTAV